MSEPRVEALRRILAEAAPLRRSDDPIAQIVGERVASIVVDTLFELDPELENPWDELAGVDEGSAA